MSNIIKDLNFLRQKSENVASVSEAKGLLQMMQQELEKSEYAVGLAAIQIGIPKRVAIIKAKNGGFLSIINPEVVDKADEFVFHGEGCLSIPNILVNVKRYKQFVIKNSVINDNEFREELQYFYHEDDYKYSKTVNLECVAVQHEMDLFDGILSIDKKIENIPVVQSEKTSRNDPCPCGSGKKYKKCCLK